jgi:hypothetical protein
LDFCTFYFVLVNELRHVVAGREADMNSVLCASASIILLETLSQCVGADSDDCVCLGIKRFGTSQGSDGNTIFLDLVDCPVEVLFTNKTQEANDIAGAAENTGV